jgi:cytochrome c-type biogenesis protein CcmF
VISADKNALSLGLRGNDELENIDLQRDSTMKMGEYNVTYVGHEDVEPNHFYLVNYVRRDSATGNVLEQFTLRPNVQKNAKMGNVANPDTKHYLTRDVFTHITYLPDNRRLPDTVFSQQLGEKDTMFGKGLYITINGLDVHPNLPKGYDPAGKVAIGVKLTVHADKLYALEPVMDIDMQRGSFQSVFIDEIPEWGFKVAMLRFDPSTKKVILTVHQTIVKPPDYIAMKAIVFPYIGLVWLGGIITFLGALFSMARRIFDLKK